ncbi:MAG: VOC family protein [Flavobacteriales bacterium]
MDKKVINGIQQIGIGTKDVQSTFKWYKDHLGFDIRVFEDEATANLMLPYTAGKPRTRHAILAMNLRGGGGMEIWQYKGRTPEAAKFDIRLGDFGVNVMKVRSKHIKESYNTIEKSGAKLLSKIEQTPAGAAHFYFLDPEHNVVEIIEDNYEFSDENSSFGGVLGVTVGVSDIEASKKFYAGILGYDQVVYEEDGTFQDLKGLPSGDKAYKRVLLRHSATRKSGGFSKLLGPTEIELVQALDRPQRKIYEGRLWGDLGYIHLCFDVNGMALLREECKAAGSPFTVDSSNSFDMGDAAGHFSYIEDPDGTLIEFVETHKVPIFKKLGLFINLKKRNPHKPLPNWMVKSMKMNRVK